MLKDYPENLVAQQPFKDKESRSVSNKRTKTVKFSNATQEVNIMKSHDGPIPKNKKGDNQKKNPKSEQAKADPSEDGRNYGIDCLNLDKPAHD